MYGFPSDLNYSMIIGEFTTQFCVGPFDLQFTLGEMHFIVSSPIKIFRNEVQVGSWNGARWPDPVFYELMNVPVASVEVPDKQILRISFENGLDAVLSDDSDQYESLQIIVGKAPGVVYII